MWRTTVAAACGLLLAIAPSGHAAFPQDPPNDPRYDGSADGTSAPGCFANAQFELFSSIPRCTPGARDAEGTGGMSVDRVWREHTTGDPSIVIAYVEGGINWHLPGADDLANQVFLNPGELPAPTTPDANPALRAADFADTKDANGNGFVDGEDLVVRFSDGRDGDGNGFTDDISGWDFYDDQNDPQTVDSAYAHANNQMDRMSAEADNGKGRAGLCPSCRVLPIRAGAEALDRTDDLAEAWLYAARMGASVVVSVTADLGYSTLLKRTAERLHRQGVIVVQASNDFNSIDHQGGMFHPHVLPGNGVVPDKLGTQAGERATTTYRQRSGITSAGPKNVLSVPTNSGTTSASTPVLGATIALTKAVGRTLQPPLSGPEAVQVLRATATDIDDPNLSWPGAPGWDQQYGYGRPNALRAAEAIKAGAIPPAAAIDSPDWYTLLGEEPVEVTGRIDAPRAGGFRWELQAAPGPQPAENAFRTIGTGTGKGRFEGRLGTLDPRELDKAFREAPYALSRTKELETAERFTVTLRLRAIDDANRVGEDRRGVYGRRDASWLDGFPKRIGPGGEAQAALFDLAGLGRLQVVFGDTDGRVHALDPKTGEELPGFPVRTRENVVRGLPEGIPAGHEPIVSNVAVGDLDGSGRPSIVASTTTGRLYAWNARGRLREGFPVDLARGVTDPPIPRPKEPYARRPAQGAFAAPVLWDHDGDGRLEVLQAAWDGHLHLVDRRGRAVDGWPVRIGEPPQPVPQGATRVRDLKLQGTPALAQLDGRGALEVVLRSQINDFPADEGVQPAPYGYVHAIRADGRPVRGWPVRLQGVAMAYGTAQEFITEGASSAAAADVDGDGDDEVAVSLVFSPTQLLDGDGRTLTTYGPVPAPTAAALAQTDTSAVRRGELPEDAPVEFTTSGAFGRFGGGLSFAQPGSGAATVAGTILTPGLGVGIVNYERAWSARGGESRAGFPAKMQGLNFLGAPLFVDVTGDGQAELVDGADSNALHAYAAGGAQAPGFPKWTTGWALWSPSAGDLDGDGRTELVQLTREGYVMAWRTPGRASGNREWWRWHHDERSTGRHGEDTRPPTTASGLSLRARGTRLSFVAGGDDWDEGRASEVRLTVFRTRRGLRPAIRRIRLPRGTDAGERVTVDLPAGTRCVRVQLVDDAGNRSVPTRAKKRAGVRRCR